MNKFFIFFLKRPIIVFQIIYLSALLFNRALLSGFESSEFLDYTWLLIFAALMLPRLGFTIATLFFKRFNYKKSIFFDIQVSPIKIKAICFVSFTLSLVYFFLTIDRAVKSGGIFLLASESESLSLYDEITVKSVYDSPFPFASYILTIGQTLPMIVAISQHLVLTSTTKVINNKAINIISFVSIIMIVSAALITGVRSLMLYPIFLYTLTSNYLKILSNNPNDYSTNFNKTKNPKSIMRSLYRFFITFLLTSIIITLFSVISSGRVQKSSQDPLSAIASQTYQYLTFGFDVLNERVNALIIGQQDYIIECSLRTVIPAYIKLADFFGFPNGLDCLHSRFSINGFTSSTYLTFLPIDNFWLFCCMIILLGLIWGISYLFSRQSILFFLLFIFISNGMLFASFTNLVVRDYLILAIFFFYPLLSVILL